MKHYIYIMTNAYRTMLYVGTTHALHQTVFNYRNGAGDDFAKKYNCKYLIYTEQWEDKQTAEIRKSELTSRSKSRQLELISETNLNLDEVKL